jgi:hypothetical protein
MVRVKEQTLVLMRELAQVRIETEHLGFHHQSAAIFYNS